MGPGELFDVTSGFLGAGGTGGVLPGGGSLGMLLTDLVPIAPVEPVVLVAENPTAPFGDFYYDLARASGGSFQGLDRTSPAADGEGMAVTYHWNSVDSVLELTFRSLLASSGGGLLVTVTDTGLSIEIDRTGLQAGDTLYFDGTDWTIYNLDDGGNGDGAFPSAGGEPLRILRGDVNDDGTPGHGDEYNGVALWTSANTGTGLFSVSFGYAFPEVPSVTLGVSFNVPSQRSRVISFTSPPAVGGFAVAIQEFNEVTQQFDYIDVAFHFQVIGRNGNYY